VSYTPINRHIKSVTPLSSPAFFTAKSPQQGERQKVGA
jgi:hypothetical protein